MGRTDDSVCMSAQGWRFSRKGTWRGAHRGRCALRHLRSSFRRPLISTPLRIADAAILVYIGICLEAEKGMPMPRNTSVSLGDHFTTFIDAQVQAGRYGSASDVVRAGLRLLQEHEARVKALEAALIEGEESGDPQPFDNAAFKARMRAEHGH